MIKLDCIHFCRVTFCGLLFCLFPTEVFRWGRFAATQIEAPKRLLGPAARAPKGVFATASALLGGLVLCLMASAHLQAAESSAAKSGPNSKVKKLKLATNETAIFVGNLHCKTCAKKLASKLYAVKGVVRVRSNVKDNLAIVTRQQKKKLDVNALWTAAQKAGFPPVKLISRQGTYVPDPKTKAAQRLPDRVAAARKQQ